MLLYGLLNLTWYWPSLDLWQDNFYLNSFCILIFLHSLEGLQVAKIRKHEEKDMPQRALASSHRMSKCEFDIRCVFSCPHPMALITHQLRPHQRQTSERRVWRKRISCILMIQMSWNGCMSLFVERLWIQMSVVVFFTFWLICQWSDSSFLVLPHSGFNIPYLLNSTYIKLLFTVVLLASLMQEFFNE